MNQSNASDAALDHFCAEGLEGKVTRAELDAVMLAMARGPYETLETDDLVDHLNWLIDLKLSAALYDALMDNTIRFTGKDEAGEVSFDFLNTEADGESDDSNQTNQLI